MKRSKESIKNAAYGAAQWTWGLPQTLLGAAVYIAHRRDPHFSHKGARVTEWNKDAGLSLGRFIFVPRRGAERRAGGEDHLLAHEYGHTIQSLILGPVYLLLVGAPSLVWMNLPFFRRKRKKTGKSYYSPVFEKTANRLGGSKLR